MKFLRPLLFWGLVFILLPTLSAQDTPSPDPYRNFDFWIGEWNVYKYGTDTLVGYSQIKPILGDKAIRETYQSSRGPYEGTSLNIYNQASQRWEQFWVDNSGVRLHIKGEIQEGAMVMESHPEMGNGVFNRISWTPESGGTVRQTWEQKTQKKESWTIVFDGVYRKKD